MRYFIDFNSQYEVIGIFFAPFRLSINSSGEFMRFLTSKTSLFLISLTFIFILFWMNLGNLKSSALLINTQVTNSQQNQFLSELGDLFPKFLKWVYEFSQPFAAEAGSSLQAWWDAQKAVMMNAAVQWLVNQQDNLSSNLHALLESIIGKSIVPQ